MLEIISNITDIKKDFSKLQQNIFKAQRSANKKIAQQIVTRVSADARARYNIKARDLKEGVKVKPLNNHDVSSRIIFSNRKVPLINFSARQGKQGVSIMVIKGQRKLITSSFIPKLRASHQNVFIRIRQGNTRVARLPIEQFYGPSPSAMMLNRNSLETVIKLINEKYDAIYEHELDYYESK